jgi:hypothetical protein
VSVWPVGKSATAERPESYELVSVKTLNLKGLSEVNTDKGEQQQSMPSKAWLVLLY